MTLGPDEEWPDGFRWLHLTLLECAPAELIRIAARAGYDAVSVRLIPYGGAQ